MSLGSCVEVRTLPCDDLICPVGSVCSPELNRCVLQDQVGPCDGQPDGTECSFPGVPDGRCIGQVCFSVGCGNGIVELGEVCDEGDTRDGDGCSADCRSDETCGNGVVDPRVGEICDDGNTVSGDGCQDHCGLPRCGDGVLDPGEACDDGNNIAGDGCNPQCTSDESCGNDVIDVAAGEACDDGNTVSADGCQGDCALPRCGDGLLDPGEACDDGNNLSGDGCNAQCSSNETCGNEVIDVAMGEECDDGNLAVGDNCGATCRIEACGNGILDPGELCDDGNIESGDGCSATCLSHEECGNGQVDPVTGEQCDDGNFRSGDGCSSRCSVEFPVWEELDIGLFSARNIHALAYDASRRRVVLFGGKVDGGGYTGASDETWEYDGLQWVEVRTTDTPQARYNHQMVYDAARHRIVLFGGQNWNNQAFDDTWEYDGHTWTEVETATSPPATAAHGMAYDASRREVVLFSGTTTWVYDGTDWTQAATAGPDQRSYPALAYHAARGTVILTGGSFGPEQVDTWEWNGTSWALLSATGGPGQVSLSYDAATGRLVAVDSDNFSHRTYVWDGTWSELSPTEGPPAGLYHQTVYDAARDRIVVAGGFRSGDLHNETWELVGDEWAQAHPRRSPGRRTRTTATFDARRQRVVVAGGIDASGTPQTDTWELDRHWHRLDRGGPSAFRGALTFDEANGQCLMVSDSGITTATWTYDGDRWLARDLATPPPIPASPMAYDSERGVVVTLRTRNTWEYDGTTWSQNEGAEEITVVTPTLAYDPLRGVVVAYGGLASGLMVGAHFEYDGTTWQRITTPTPLLGRYDATIVFHHARGTIILFGGRDSFNATYDETWEYDGVDWTPVETPIRPPARISPLMVDDTNEHRVLMFGGGVDNDEDSTWQLSWVSGDPKEHCDVVGDEDGDGLFNCDDPDCAGSVCGDNGQVCTGGTCQCAGGPTEASCGNHFDDDCDGLVDCADPDCAESAHCNAEPDCADGTDDDFDGAADCQDTGCDGVGVCEAIESSCGDGEDNDGDGAIDCADTDCFLNPCPSVAP